MANIKLSIIIPAYNSEPYIEELLNRLAPQITNEVEVIVIDDGSRVPYIASVPKVKVTRQANGGVSSARNKGLELAKGDYIAFVDSDDLISTDYVKTIFDNMGADVLWLSWEAFDGWNAKVHLGENDDFPSWNLCVWNRVYKRDVIGDIRFNEKKKVAEDAEFIREVKVGSIKRIGKPIYFYRSSPHDSLTQRICEGKVEMTRIVYYFPRVTKDMTYLIDEMKAVYDDTEVILMTEQNDIPELKDYALVMKPAIVYGTELRGERTSLYRQIPKGIHTQVAIYIGNTQEIGGVETWMYNFIATMYKLYDIIILYESKVYPKQIEKFSKYVLVHKLGNQPIFCDSFINMRITDKIPKQIVAKQVIQMCHTCKMLDWKIQKDYDKLVYVSDTARQTFEEKGITIHNLTYREPMQRPLMLITASRFSFEKGIERMYRLAEQFKAHDIEILWLVFTNCNIEQKNGIVRMLPSHSMREWMKRADYTVQLSDMESYCYSIVESLEEGTPVLTTPITVLKELGFRDQKDGYILPFDMQGIDVERIANHIPKVKGYDNCNSEIVEQWKALLGDTKPKGTYNTDKPFLKVRALEFFGDLELGRNVQEGEVVQMRRERAIMWLSRGKVEIVDE